ncbi:helix-turn-helix domain-containing protein [Paenibacillus montanisoli]|uniref:DNA topoisomerase (ATP-hydrolyzing) n=1 Tax=Paenibacillus montanisoli TaxID=2081970 RepID=A0A328U226_9BACL|nr:helix-turn-helix domain-containing protein [Paenibacillus montanisoli]RAP74054.1 ArsR family transcriptional regulator [Paenibacillus montanisoli]
MSEKRDFGAELDWLKEQLLQLQAQMMKQQPGGRSSGGAWAAQPQPGEQLDAANEHGGMLHYAGSFQHGSGTLKWAPQERPISELTKLDSEKGAKIIAALGHKQRLDILRAIIEEPRTGAELVERLNMGTTGQLYHHIKALAGADLLHQEERGGTYSVPEHRLLPILLLLAAAKDLSETSDYLAMSEARERAGDYLGNPAAQGKHDPHLLLWAVLENSILEHEAGFCSELHLFLHDDRSITASDNGRGIPTRALEGSGKTLLHTVMTDLEQLAVQGAVLTAPGSARGINIAVVNAMSDWLQVDIQREGTIVRQQYRHGIPQHPLLTVGVTCETGTSVTFLPDQELFEGGFDLSRVKARCEELMRAFPKLAIRVHS